MRTIPAAHKSQFKEKWTGSLLFDQCGASVVLGIFVSVARGAPSTCCPLSGCFGFFGTVRAHRMNQIPVAHIACSPVNSVKCLFDYLFHHQRRRHPRIVPLALLIAIRHAMSILMRLPIISTRSVGFPFDSLSIRFTLDVVVTVLGPRSNPL